MTDTLAPIAPIASEVIYEDAHVRVWNQVVPPGGTIDRRARDDVMFRRLANRERELAPTRAFDRSSL
jgi:hypothetical protein